MSRMTRAGMLGFLFCAFGLTVAGEQSDGDTFPYHIKLFSIPEQYHSIFDNYRQNWTRLTGFEYSGLHWKQFVCVYTRKGEESYRHNYLEYISWFDDPDEEENEPQYIKYPQGTLLLKENFTSHEGKPGEAIAVTVMIKHAPGYDPTYGDWEYLQFDAKGKILLNGNSQNKNVSKNCVSCHSNVANRDYVFSQIHSTLHR